VLQVRLLLVVVGQLVDELVEVLSAVLVPQVFVLAQVAVLQGGVHLVVCSVVSIVRK
jgi:hypothetical protein